FSPAECNTLLDEIIQRLDELAEKVRGVVDGRLPAGALANPGPGCCWCPYRPICSAYRDYTQTVPESEQQSRVDVWGRFQGLKPARRGLIVLDLEVGGKSRLVADFDPSPSRNPAIDLLQPGDVVGVFDARQNTL